MPVLQVLRSKVLKLWIKCLSHYLPKKSLNAATSEQFELETGNHDRITPLLNQRVGRCSRYGCNVGLFVCGVFVPFVSDQNQDSWRLLVEECISEFAKTKNPLLLKTRFSQGCSTNTFVID